MDVATSGVEERPSRPWRCRIPSWRKPTEEVLGSSKSSASLVEVLVESSQSSYETPIVRIVTRDVAVDVRHPHHLPPPPPLESASSPSSLSKDLRFFVLDISLSLPFRPQLSPLAIPPMIHLAYLQHRSIAGVDSLESRTPRPSSPFTPPPPPLPPARGATSAKSPNGGAPPGTARPRFLPTSLSPPSAIAAEAGRRVRIDPSGLHIGATAGNARLAASVRPSRLPAAVGRRPVVFTRRVGPASRPRGIVPPFSRKK